MEHNLLGKRKKRFPAVPNPLFTKWLSEWKLEAQEKGWKSQHIFSRALKSLAKFPLPLETGKDCKLLQNFGEKICKMLDDKLAQYKAENPEAFTQPVKKKKKSSSTASSSAPSTKTSAKPASAPSKPRTRGGNSARETNPVRASSTRDVHAISDEEGMERNGANLPQTTRVREVHSLSDSDEEGMERNRAKLPQTSRVREVHALSDSDEDELPPPKAQKRKPCGRRTREYVPAPRSGAHALLVALYRNTQSALSRGFMTKAELIRAAQPLADTSFTVPVPGVRYTAWSSMGTLVKKGLVSKQSSPANYFLTEAGSELAAKLELVGGGETGARPPGTSEGVSPPTLPPQAPAPHLPSGQSSSGSRNHGSCDKQGLVYWYVSDSGDLVKEKDQAAVLVDDDISLGFLVRTNYQQLLQSGKLYKMDNTRPLGEDVYVYLSDTDAAEVATASDGSAGSVLKDLQPNTRKTGREPHAPSRLPACDRLVLPEPSSPVLPKLTSKRGSSTRTTVARAEPVPEACLGAATSSSSLQTKPTVSTSDPLWGDDDDDIIFMGDIYDEKAVTATHVGETGITVPAAACASSSSNSSSASAGFAAPPARLACSNPGSSSSSNLESCFQTSRVSALSAAMEDCDSQDSTASASTSTSTSTLPPPDFSLRPGEFEIVLCVDNREFYGRSGCKNLLPDLVRNGVNCDLRELQVGDLLWVAREKAACRPGELGRPRGKELVLNYIVERKRMDDFVSSIVDGRLREQKFRLKHCGLQTAIFLIEQYGSTQHFSISEDRLKQGITNTQVIDGFKVKWTKSGHETVTYLTLMTRYLQSHFKDKTLHACSLEALQDFQGSFDVNQQDHYLMPFPHFNQASVKSKLLSVREMFGKQLIQLHGMSAEKARAVLEQYPTPAHLIQAYDSCKADKERETLLSAVKCGKAKRSLGVNQSKQIFQLYCTKSALT